MQKIGLSGVTGHLGSVVYQTLLNLGIPCKLLLRKELAEYSEKEQVVGHLNEVEKLNDFTKGCTAVIHCAGMVWPKKGRNPNLIEINLDGTKRLFEQCKKNQVLHFVYVSSIHSMDIPAKTETFDESAQLTTDETNAYDFSKAEAERYLAKQDGIKITVINPTAIIGPGDTNLRGMNQLFYLLFRNKLPMVTSGGFYVIDARTVAEALINAVLLGKTGKYLVGGTYYSVKKLASLYGDVNELNGKRMAIPPLLLKLIAFLATPIDYFVQKPLPLNMYAVETLLNAHPNIVSDRSFAELNLTHIPIEKTLQDLHAWFLKEF